MTEVVWLPRARLDYSSIAIYLGIEQHAPQAARAAVSKIEETVALLAEFPDAGRQVDYDDLRRRGYRRAIAGHYHIYYRHTAGTLTICRILHERQSLCDYALMSLDDETRSGAGHRPDAAE